MYKLYSFLLTLGFCLMLPRFFFDYLRKGKYADGFRQRLGKLPDFHKNGSPIIWIHCVSVGETNAAFPLIKEILEKFPNYRLVVSTTTKTGQELAQKLYGDLAALVFYFPFDWKFTVRRVLEIIKPNIVLLMETELWFNFIREANKSGAGVFIVNGRLSQKSFDRYLYIKDFMRRIFHHVTFALMQDDIDAHRIKKLGLRANKVRVTGNIKFDQNSDETNSELTEELRKRFGISANAPLIVAASTHSPEEELIFQAFQKITANSKQNAPRLLIAPRHPERFAKVAELLKNSGFEYAKRSDPSLEKDKNAQVILLDSVGELRSVLPLAEIVFVGGSLIPHGGQNILEPAIVSKAIVTGFYTMNFAAIVSEFLKHDALIQLPKLKENEVPEKLAEVLSELLQDGEKRAELAEKAFTVAEKNRGATQKTINYLKPFLLVNSRYIENSTQVRNSIYENSKMPVTYRVSNK